MRRTADKLGISLSTVQRVKIESRTRVKSEDSTFDPAKKYLQFANSIYKRIYNRYGWRTSHFNKAMIISMINYSVF